MDEISHISLHAVVLTSSHSLAKQFPIFIRIIMKNFGILLIVLLSTSLLVSASPATSKEHKKKLLDKLRAALTTNEAESPVAVEVVPIAEEISEKIVERVGESSAASEEEEEVEGVGVGVVGVEIVQDEIGGGVVTTLENNKVDSTETVTNTYMSRFRTVFKRVMEMLGLRRRKDGRQSRLLAFDRMDNNDLDRVPAYQEEVRTTVGAVLGQKECIQKAACVSGSYLKGVKGKQLIFALLDVFSPNTWKETVKIAKQSAIFNESCNYKCLDD